MIRHDAGMYLIALPQPGDALVIWPDGGAIRVRPAGSTVPPTPSQADPILEAGPASYGLDQRRCAVLSRGARRKRHRLGPTSPRKGQAVAAASPPTLAS